MVLKRNKLTCRLAIVFGILLFCACGGQRTAEDKRLAQVNRDVGEAYMRQGNYTAALRELLKAEKMNPEDPFIQNDLGLCYLNKQRISEAIVHFKKAVALKPDFAPARNNLGTAYLALKEWDTAIAIFKEISQDALYATPHYPLSNIGLAYYHKGEYNTALVYYKKALKIQENFVNALRGAGRTYLAMHQGHMALRYFERAVDIAPKSPEIHFELAEANLMIGRKRQAILSYEDAIEMAMPESDVTKKAMMRLRSLR